jgi:thiosulfate/3-mercaptopyruvate sulfurtransferase
MSLPTNLVSTEWLGDHLSTDDLVIFDASWHLPTAKRDAKVEFSAQHVSGARFFDIDLLSDRSSTLPHMLPSAAQFQEQVRALGVRSSSKVVAYDAAGLFSAARCWWMFKVFGHDKVSVLDGGLPKWLAENRAIESGTSFAPAVGDFIARFNATMVASIEDVASGKAQIVDARSPTRFRGEEPEPRPGVRPGHIPGAHNVHYASLLNSDGTLISREYLEQRFTAAGIEPFAPVVTSCGSGVTAAILTLALTELGAQNYKLYDGSWAEWGASGRSIDLG